eukprot:COSAG02_NODE_6323_length_3651_cov_5.749437_2_plen_48_part_00
MGRHGGWVVVGIAGGEEAGVEMAQALRGNWVPGVAMVRVNAGYTPLR